MPSDPQREFDAPTRERIRKSLRKTGIEGRRALSAERCAELSERVRAQLRAHLPQLAHMRVAFCWPIHNEPDLRPLLLEWIAGEAPGFTALLPVVLSTDAPLAFRQWTQDTAMTIDRYGIPAPREGAFIVPEALLIPVNAFDAAGYRIGYGGGFFDRTLASISPPPLAIGVGFEMARVESVQPEAHDVRLDIMVTEAGAYSMPPPPAESDA